MKTKRIINNILYPILSLSILSGFSCSKNPVDPLDSRGYGIIEGIVKINPSPYSIGMIGGNGAGGTPCVTIKALGESHTMEWVGGWGFHEIENTGVYQSSFSLGAYDGNENSMNNLTKGVIPGIYSVMFFDGYFNENGNSGDRTYLEDKVVSTIGDSDNPIEVKAGRTTHIGVITLTPQ